MYRHERDHGALFTQRPVSAPLPATALQPQRAWPPRPSGQANGRPDGLPFIDRNRDGKPDVRPNDGRGDGRNDGRNDGVITVQRWAPGYAPIGAAPGEYVRG